MKNNLPKMYYTVNNKIFFNVYLAYYESFTSGQQIEFYCNDAEYDRLNWAVEPEQSLDELMSIHAHNLRNKHEKLVLLWSGGTDSHTIYNIFKQNNIHIDEIVVCFDDTDTEEGMPAHHVAWINNNHWDPTTEISTTLRMDTESKKLTVDSDNWIFENKPFLIKFSTSTCGDYLEKYLNDKYSGTNWTAVAGYEKPFVYFNNGNWYSRQHNKVLAGTIGLDYLECFYLDPIIHLKQSHLAKNALKKVKEHNGEKTNKLFHDNMVTNIKGSALEYRAWTAMIGRHKELTHGVSHSQKIYNSRTTNAFSTIPEDLDNAVLEPYLKEQLKNKNTVALDYINGLYNLKSEKLFVDYLNDNCLRERDRLLDTKIIWSKSYNLGP
jgi:hypothetical protein